MRYICNVFTIAMAPQGGALSFHEISANQAGNLIRNAPKVCHAVGHEQTAKLANESLGEHLVEFNRISARLEHGDDLVICQYVGPRLPEGATSLPEGAKLVWYYATFEAELPAY